MSMKGELGLFSAAEILQLIAVQEKSGVLQVRSKGRTAVLFFDSGKIVSARDRRQSTSDPFLTYLLENGLISIDDLHKIMDVKKQQGGDTVEIMLAENMTDETTIGERLSSYAQQIVANIVKWEAGSYEFAASCDGLPDKRLGKPLRLEPLLMEALRRKDEVEQIRRFLPGLETRLDISEPDYETLPLEPDDMAILKLVNGERTIDQIIEESGVDEVETLDILEKLFALGIIAIAAKTTGAGGQWKISAMTSALLVSGLLAAALALRLTILAPSHGIEHSAGQLRSSVADFAEARNLENVRLALDAFKVIKGTYPDNLSDLVSAGLLPPDETRDRRGREFAYRHMASNDSYVLSSNLERPTPDVSRPNLPVPPGSHP
ncbi:MAG TPA: DUF4388 domain-containing protein [bacterium]|nr:DUF4388 domain-containing protein [bacterium]